MSCAHAEAISPSHVRETNWHLRRDAQHYCSITRRRESNQLGRRESRAAADGSAGHCQFAIDCDSTRRRAQSDAFQYNLRSVIYFSYFRVYV